MKVTIVIPNWNGAYLLKKHLQKVIDAANGAQIIVADDQSTDDSLEYLEKNFPQVKIVVKTKREGFAANVNNGASLATGDIIVLLNTDVAPQQDFLKPLLTHFKDPEVFAVGCLEKSPEAGNVVLRGRGLGHWEKGFYIHKKGEVNDGNTAWVSGGSGAFRKRMWDQLGGMDVIFNPFYWEDIDLSYRARKAGWKTIFEPKSIVWHYHEEGKIKKEFTADEVRRIVYRNQFLFIWKNITQMSLFLAHVLWCPIRLTQSLIARDTLMVQGFFMALGKVFLIRENRSKQKSLNKLADQHIDLWET